MIWFAQSIYFYMVCSKYIFDGQSILQQSIPLTALFAPSSIHLPVPISARQRCCTLTSWKPQGHESFDLADVPWKFVSALFSCIFWPDLMIHKNVPYMYTKLKSDKKIRRVVSSPLISPLLGRWDLKILK